MCVVNLKSVNKLDLTWKQSFLINSQSLKNVISRTFPVILMKLIIVFYGILKMSHGQALPDPDPDPELINAKSLNFAKTKLFFKNIG